MAIELPGPVADFLGFIGISWPNVNEDKVREFGDHVAQFAAELRSTHEGAGGTLQHLGGAYEGEGYEQLLAAWGRMSSQHMDELLTACDVVSTAMNIAADVVVGMKLEAIGELIALVAQFVAAQAAAVATFGLAEASLVLIETEGRQIVRFLEQELVQYVEGKVLDAAVGPLVAVVERAVEGMVYRGVADALGVPAGGAGAGAGVRIEPEAVLSSAAQLREHAGRADAAGQRFASVAGSVTFE
jgi:hypothetical protein